MGVFLVVNLGVNFLQKHVLFFPNLQQVRPLSLEPKKPHNYWQDPGNVATDRLVYQDVRGLSAAEPCLRGRIWGCRMLGCCQARPVGSWALSGASGGQAQLTRITQTSARANGADPGSSPGKRGIKAYRLYPVGIGLTLKRFQADLPHNCWGVLQA